MGEPDGTLTEADHFSGGEEGGLKKKVVRSERKGMEEKLLRMNLRDTVDKNLSQLPPPITHLIWDYLAVTRLNKALTVFHYYKGISRVTLEKQSVRIQNSQFTFNRLYDCVRNITIHRTREVKTVELRCNGAPIWTFENEKREDKVLVRPFTGLNFLPLHMLVFSQIKLLLIERELGASSNCIVEWEGGIHPRDECRWIVDGNPLYLDMGANLLKVEGGLGGTAFPPSSSPYPRADINALLTCGNLIESTVNLYSDVDTELRIGFPFKNKHVNRDADVREIARLPYLLKMSQKIELKESEHREWYGAFKCYSRKYIVLVASNGNAASIKSYLLRSNWKGLEIKAKKAIDKTATTRERASRVAGQVERYNARIRRIEASRGPRVSYGEFYDNGCFVLERKQDGVVGILFK